MCAQSLLPREGRARPPVYVTAHEGAFYATLVDEAALVHEASGCRQHALFHFQEWKKKWEEPVGGAGEKSAPRAIAPLKPADTLSSPAFRVTVEGISPLTIPQ